MENFFSDNQISVFIKHLGFAVVILIIAFLLNRFVRYVLRKYFESEAFAINSDPTNYRFFQNGISAVIFSFAVFLIFYSIPELKTLGVTLFASAGIFAAVLGFASQQAFSNIVSGIFMVIFKPFKVGDIVKIGADIIGVVEDITLRHTVIKSFENKRFIIPNATISTDVILNSSITDERTCSMIEIGISYDSDIEKAKTILKDEVEKHPMNIDFRNEEDIKEGKPRVLVRVIGLGDSSVNLRAWAWAENHPNAFVLKCDVTESIKLRFDREGIEIPFPHRTIVYKKDLISK